MMRGVEHGRIGRMAAASLVTAILAGGVMCVQPKMAYASQASELDQAAQRLEELGAGLADLESQLEEASSELEAAERASVEKDEQVEAVREDLKSMRGELSDMMRANYKAGDMWLLDFLLGARDVEELVSHIYYLDKMSEQRADAIETVQATKEQLEREQTELDVRRAEQKSVVDELQALVEEQQSLVSDAASVYDSLDEQTRQELVSRGSENVTLAVEAVEESREQGQDGRGQTDGQGSEQTNSGEEDQLETPNDAGQAEQVPSDDQEGTGAVEDEGWVPSGDGGQDFTNRRPDATLGTVTWTGDSEYLNGLIRLANREGSATDWFISFDNELMRTVVLRRSGGSWQIVKTWNCVGAINTYSGKWSVLHKRESNWYSETFDWFQGGNGPNAWSTDYIWGIRPTWSQNHERWVDSPYGSGYEDCAAIHATGYTANMAPEKANRGCCGLLNANAKWVYDNIPIGTTVYEFEYSRANFF